MITRLLFVLLIFLQSTIGLAEHFKADINIVTYDNQKPLIAFNLKDNYKIYYRHPGFFGSPPIIKYKNHFLNFSYQTPERFNINGFTHFAYESKTYFVVDRKLHPGSKVDLEYAICNHNCLFEKQQITVKKISKEKYYSLLNEINLHKVKYDNKVLEIEIIQQDNKLFFKPQTLPNVKDIIIHSENFITHGFKNNHGEILFNGSIEEKIKILTEKKPEILIIYDNNGSEIYRPKFSFKKNKDFTIWYLLLTAFIGGIILNLMPCILPIITLKVYSCFTRNSNSDLIFNVLGIITSMLCIALLQITAKESSQSFILGSQFTNSNFISATTIIITLSILMSLNRVNIILPPMISNLLTHNRNNYLTSLAGGFFVTLIATPCSAPFLGLALGASLTTTHAQTLMIFLSMGLGLSLPYILLLLSPKFTKKILPKPGKWLDNFKQVLIFALILFNFWLLYILYTQTGVNLTTKIIIANLMVILFLGSNKNKAVKGIISLVIFILSLNLIINQYQDYKVKLDSNWIEFDDQLLEKNIQEGKIVFVDITASWCITCQYNHLTTLNTSAMQRFFNQHNIILMRGDLSRNNETITRFINKYGRAGIPFNAFFSSQLPEPLILNEILNQKKIVKAFNNIK